MKTKKIWANLGIADLKRTAKFYTDLGFKPNGHNNSDQLVSFLFGDDDFIIHFFVKERLEENAQIKVADLQHGNEIIFSLSADSKADVDTWLEAVKNAGATIYAEPQNFDKGYTFGFADPDGHKFNVLYWPG